MLKTYETAYWENRYLDCMVQAIFYSCSMVDAALLSLRVSGCPNSRARSKPETRSPEVPCRTLQHPRAVVPAPAQLTAGSDVGKHLPIAGAGLGMLRFAQSQWGWNLEYLSMSGISMSIIIGPRRM